MTKTSMAALLLGAFGSLLGGCGGGGSSSGQAQVRLVHVSPGTDSVSVTFGSATAAALPRDTGRAGYVDAFNGDFVPAVDVGTPANLARLLAQSEVLLLCTLSLVEQDLKTGGVVIVPTPELDFRASYGFMYLKSRPLSPATLAFMTEFRRHEKTLAAHEAELAAQFRPTGKRAAV